MKMRKEWWYVVILVLMIIVLMVVFRDDAGFSPKKLTTDNSVNPNLQNWVRDNFRISKTDKNADNVLQNLKKVVGDQK